MQMEMSTGRGSWAAGRTGGNGDFSKAVVPVLGAVGLGVLALTRRSVLGKLLFAVPAVVVGGRAVDAVKDLRSARMIGHGTLIDESVHISRNPREVYDFFRKFENLPSFMHHTHDVREDAGGGIHWAARLANGLGMEWDAVLLEDKPGELISWHSAPGEPFEESGTVRFLASDGGTTVMFRVARDYEWSPAGLMIAKGTEGWTSDMVADELRSLKAMLEARAEPTSGHAPPIALQPEPV